MKRLAPAASAAATRVAPFDRAAFQARLGELNGRILPAADEPDVVGFMDNNGVIVEVRVAE